MTSDPPKRRPRQVIGWREWVGLPAFGVERIKAKVDTGARTSTLHAFDIEIADRDGLSIATFELHTAQRGEGEPIAAQALVVGWRDVRSSNGVVEHRPAIETTIQLGEASWKAELTLTRRDEMGFRMLIGRTAIRRRYLVDPGRSYTGGADRVPRP